MRALLRSLAPSVTFPLFVAAACTTGTPPSTGDDTSPSGGNTPSAGGGAGNPAGSGGTAMDTGGSAAGGSGGYTGGGAGTGSSMAGAGGTAAGSGGNGATGGVSAGAGGTTGGSAGLSAAGGPSGGGGAGAGTGSGGAPSTGGMPGAGGAGTAGAPAAWPACSADALFCSGFEDAGLPMGATYLSSNDNNDPTKGLAFDKTVFHGGAQSVEILKIASYAQREIVVPAAQLFWFRAYLRTDVAIGGAAGNNHNLFFEAAWPGSDKGIEIVEEDCELGMNIMDTRYGSNGTMNQPGCPTAAPLGTQLAENVWHCIEGYFDGGKGDFRLFADGQEVITQTGVAGAKQPFSTLRFGYREYHERQRLVWYDDVVTGPTRIGCP